MGKQMKSKRLKKRSPARNQMARIRRTKGGREHGWTSFAGRKEQPVSRENRLATKVGGKNR